MYECIIGLAKLQSVEQSCIQVFQEGVFVLFHFAAAATAVPSFCLWNECAGLNAASGMRSHAVALTFFTRNKSMFLFLVGHFKFYSSSSQDEETTHCESTFCGANGCIPSP